MRKKLNAIAALLLGTQAACVKAGDQALTVTDAHYGITLQGDWIEERSNDDDQHLLYSKERDTGLVISSVGMSPNRSNTEEVARKMIDFRLKGEEQAAAEFGIKMHIVAPIIVKRPWGHAIAYYGSDAKGRRFSYAGAVIPSAVISVYVESKSASENSIKETLDTILKSLTFDKATTE